MDADDMLNPKLLVPVAIVLVLLIGVGVAVVTVVLGKKKKAALDLWAHGAWGLWSGMEDSAAFEPKRAQAAFKSWYGAVSGAQAQDTIRGLVRGQTGSAAWDKIRALDLIRMALAAGYMDLDQCRTEVAKIARELQRDYRTWDDLARAFETGMQKWQQGAGINDPQELGRVQRHLPILRAQIWPKVRFDAPLVAPD